MRQVARYHLYLGCFFAPLILFYAMTGTWQALNLHRFTKTGYDPPFILAFLSEVHVHQRLPVRDIPESMTVPGPDDVVKHVLPKTAYPWLASLMSIGLASTTILGLVLAYLRTRGRRRWLTGSCAISGCLLPVLLLITQRF